MIAYDLDDTLARVRWGTDNPRSFRTAGVIATPSEDFIIITARPHATAAEREATLTWLHENQPHYRGIHYVPAGSEEAKATAKAAVIKNTRITSYTDNNRDTLRIIKTLVTGVTLYHANHDGSRTRY